MMALPPVFRGSRTLAMGLLIANLLDAHAQSITLPGSIAVHNSAYETGRREYISDASVRAPLARPAVSDRTGKFALEFAGVNTGTPVRLSVSKPGYEVVNTREVQGVILGRIPAVEVLMADAQKLAEAQLKYYRIATEGITRSYHRKLTALDQENVALADRLSRFSAEHEREVKSLMEAIDVLTAERDRALGNAGEIAERFATADLDRASDRFRQAFELFQRGQLDSALVLLDKDRLDADYTAARAVKEQANEQIRQVFSSLELKVSVLSSAMDHAAALPVLDDMAAILKADPDAFPPITECELAWSRGNVLVSMSRFADAIAVFARGRELARERFGERDLAQLRFIQRQAECEQELDGYSRSMELLREELDLLQGHADDEALALADVEFSLSRAFEHGRDLDSAMVHAERSLALRKAHLPATHEKVLRSMQAVALIMRAQGRYDQTLELQLEMLDLAGPDGVNYGRWYGTLLHNIGQEYKTKSRFDEAERFLRSSLEREIKDLGQQHPHVLVNSISLAGLMDDLGREQEAIALLDSALVRNKGTVAPEHNIMGYYYTVRASALSDLGDQDAAMEAIQRALSIRLKVHGPKHPYVVATQEVMAMIQARKGDLEGALGTTSAMLEVIIEVFGPDDINTHFVATSKANYLVDLVRDTAALALYGRHLAPMVQVFGEQDPGIRNARVRMATALYRTGVTDSARVVFERINSIVPDQQAEWYLSKIALAADNEEEAMGHLVRSARLLDEGTDPEHRKVVMYALKELAVRLDRKDVLEEFKLAE